MSETVLLINDTYSKAETDTACSLAERYGAKVYRTDASEWESIEPELTAALTDIRFSEMNYPDDRKSKIISIGLDGEPLSGCSKVERAEDKTLIEQTADALDERLTAQEMLMVSRIKGGEEGLSEMAANIARTLSLSRREYRDMIHSTEKKYLSAEGYEGKELSDELDEIDREEVFHHLPDDRKIPVDGLHVMMDGKDAGVAESMVFLDKERIASVPAYQLVRTGKAEDGLIQFTLYALDDKYKVVNSSTLETEYLSPGQMKEMLESRTVEKEREKTLERPAEQAEHPGPERDMSRQIEAPHRTRRIRRQG